MPELELVDAFGSGFTCMMIAFGKVIFVRCARYDACCVRYQSICMCSATEGEKRNEKNHAKAVDIERTKCSSTSQAMHACVVPRDRHRRCTALVVGGPGRGGHLSLTASCARYVLRSMASMMRANRRAVHELRRRAAAFDTSLGVVASVAVAAKPRPSSDWPHIWT